MMSSFKEKSTQVFWTLVCPIFVGLHYVTEHSAWIYLIGIMSIIALFGLIMSLVIFVVAFFVDVKNEIPRRLAREEKQKYQWLLSLFPIFVIIYLLFIEAYFVSTIYIFSGVLGLCLLWLIKITRNHGLQLLEEDEKEQQENLDRIHG